MNKLGFFSNTTASPKIFQKFLISDRVIPSPAKKLPIRWTIHLSQTKFVIETGRWIFSLRIPQLLYYRCTVCSILSIRTDSIPRLRIYTVKRFREGTIIIIFESRWKSDSLEYNQFHSLMERFICFPVFRVPLTQK